MVLGGHGLFTWGDTQRESYLNTITIIDQLGQFIAATVRNKPNRLAVQGSFAQRRHALQLNSALSARTRLP